MKNKSLLQCPLRRAEYELMIEIMLQSFEVCSSSLHPTLQISEVIVVPCFLDEDRYNFLQVLFAIGKLLLQDEGELLVLFVLQYLL
jgi:hypothetical protein